MGSKVLSIIIPTFNEETLVTKTISTVLAANSSGYQKELIVVDDGSTDGTKKTLSDLFKSNKKGSVKFIFKQKNEGKGAALKDGIAASKGDIILIQDADLEYNPAEYPLLLEPFIKNGADVVYGSRFISNRPHRVLYFWHYQVNLLLTRFSNMLTNLNLTDMETGYKVFRGELLRRIGKDLRSKRFGFEPEITARISKIKGLKIYEVGISYYGRTYEEGKKIGWRDGVRAVWEIIRFNLFA